MSSGGQNTVTQNSAPPAYVQQAYQNLLTTANQDIANQPTFQPYGGNTVAGLSPDQQAAIGQIQGAQGIANPYINAAAGEIGASTTPLAPTIQPYVNQAEGALGWVAPAVAQGQSYIGSAAAPVSSSDISQYESPYTQQVVNATQAQFNNQNAQQQQQVQSGAAGQGALGGDRASVAAGITAGQEQLAQAPVIAGLENQGYAQALQEANTQQQAKLQAGQGMLQSAGVVNNLAQGYTGLGSQVLGANEANNWLASQAGYGMANLGNEALNTDLTGASALMGVGGTEQQIAQEQLNVPYQNYIANQAYPFQTTNWLSGITTGTGSSAGGTSSSTSPGPSALSQTLGTGLTTAGILGMTGAFGTGGWLTGAGAAGASALAGESMSGMGLGADAAMGLGAFLVKDGGAVPERAPGGIVPSNNVIPFPQHRVNRGIAPANDDMPPPIQRRAAGGIAVPQLPTNATSAMTAPNGIVIPQLPTSGGGIAPQGGGMGAVNSYLANNAPFVPPAPAPAPMAAPAPAPTAAPPAAAPAPSGIVPGSALDRNFTPGGPDETAAQSEQWFRDYGGSGSSGGTARGGAIRRDDGGDVPNSGVDLPDWAGGRGDHQGIVPLGRQHLSAIPAGPDVGITPDNTTSWQDDRPALAGASGAAPQFSMPDTGTGGGIAPQMPQNRPPIRPVSHQTASNGIGPPPPPPPTQDAGFVDDGSWDVDSGGAAAPAHDATKAAAKSSAPWETLIAAGLGIMGGTSPHAGVNIGQGGLKGLQFGESQRVREENAELRRLQQEDLAQWRQQTAGINQQKIPILQDRANTAATAVDNRGAYQRGLLAARARGQTDAEFNQQWLQNFRQTGQDLQANKSIDASARGWAGLDQRTTQQQQNAAEAKRNHDLMEADRQARMKQTTDQNDRKFLQHATDQEYSDARTIYNGAINNGQKITWDQAHNTAVKSRQESSQPQASQPQATPTAPPQQPKTVPPGSAYSPSRGQWRDQDGRLYDAQGAPIS